MHVKRLFIFGYGYTAAAVAKRLMQEDGWEITATSRNSSKRKELKRLGIEAIDFDDTDAVATALQEQEYLLVSIPPAKAGDITLSHYETTIAAQRWQWIGYLSSTGVYGDHHGSWVTEDTPIAPHFSALAQRRCEAESSWKKLAKQSGLPLHIFRLAGIYGPGRNAIAQLKRNEARLIIKEGQFFSRSHVDDIAQTLHHSMRNPDSTFPAIYNVADDLPAPSHEVVEYAAQLLRLPAPTPIDYANAELSEKSAEFWRANKRVANDKLKKALGITLLYPSYKEGLNALL